MTKGGAEPSFIHLSDDAEESFHQWREGSFDPHQGGFMGGFRGKLPAYVLRMSLILELLEWSLAGDRQLPAAISRTAVSRAIKLADEYLLPMAIRTYADVSKEQDEEDATTLARYLQRRRVTAFNARALGRESGLPGMSNRKRRDKAIALLEEAGWIRREPSPGPGRNAINFAVNPAVLASGG